MEQVIEFTIFISIMALQCVTYLWAYLYLSIPFWYSSAAYQESMVEP